MARLPSWRDHYLGLDQDRHYAFLRRELQVLSYLRGPRHWVLKTPQHLEQLGPLLRTFPDATVALTVRDPVDVLQSAVTMLAYGDRLRRVEIDADGLAAYWTDRIERLLRAFVRDLDLLARSQRVDVAFHEFMADDLATIERIYEVAGGPVSTALHRTRPGGSAIRAAREEPAVDLGDGIWMHVRTWLSRAITRLTTTDETGRT